MKSKMLKILIPLLVFTLFVFIASPIINVKASSKIDVGAFKEVTNPNVGSGIATFGGRIIYIVQYAGYTVAVLVLIGIGIKYMTSAPSEKADLKSRLIPYVIGAVLLFGGVSIISMIYDIVTKVQ